MKLSPLNVKIQEFKSSFKGYDQDEVKSFLEKVAEDMEELVNENTEMKKYISEIEIKLREYQKIEKNLQDTLLKAQETSTRTLEAVKKQASLIMKDAELKSEQIIESAKDKAQRHNEQLIRIKEERNLFLAKLKALVNSQASVLDSFSGDKSGISNRIVEEVHYNTPPESFNSKLNVDVDGIVNNLLL